MSLQRKKKGIFISVNEWDAPLGGVILATYSCWFEAAKTREGELEPALTQVLGQFFSFWRENTFISILYTVIHD